MFGLGLVALVPFFIFFIYFLLFIFLVLTVFFLLFCCFYGGQFNELVAFLVTVKNMMMLLLRTVSW